MNIGIYIYEDAEVLDKDWHLACFVQFSDKPITGKSNF